MLKERMAHLISIRYVLIIKIVFHYYEGVLAIEEFEGEGLQMLGGSEYTSDTCEVCAVVIG